MVKKTANPRGQGADNEEEEPPEVLQTSSMSMRGDHPARDIQSQDRNQKGSGEKDVGLVKHAIRLGFLEVLRDEISPHSGDVLGYFLGLQQLQPGSFLA